MKPLIALALAAILSGCSGPQLRKPPCNLIQEREDEFVCGKKDVMKRCRLVPEHNEYVCDPV